MSDTPIYDECVSYLGDPEIKLQLMHTYEIQHRLDVGYAIDELRARWIEINAETR